MSAADHQRTDGRDHAAGRPQRWRVHYADAEPPGDQGMEVWVGPHDCPSFWMEKGGRGEASPQMHSAAMTSARSTALRSVSSQGREILGDEARR